MQTVLLKTPGKLGGNQRYEIYMQFFIHKYLIYLKLSRVLTDAVRINKYIC